MIKKHFWKSEGVITLFATLLGVFLALYLNEWSDSRKANKQKEIATENILMEIKSNKEKLKYSVSNYSKMLETFIFFKNCINNNGEVVSSVEYMTEFKARNPGIIITKDSIKLKNGNYHYTRMDLNLDFTLEQVELRTIAWQTLKSSNIISSFNFNYLMNLEYFYNSIDAIIRINNEIYSSAIKFVQNDMGVIDNLIFNVRMAIDNENKLIEDCEEQFGK